MWCHVLPLLWSPKGLKTKTQKYVNFLKELNYKCEASDLIGMQCLFIHKLLNEDMQEQIWTFQEKNSKQEQEITESSSSVINYDSQEQSKKSDEVIKKPQTQRSESWFLSTMKMTSTKQSIVPKATKFL